MPGVPNLFGAVGHMHYARQRSGGIQLHNQCI